MILVFGGPKASGAYKPASQNRAEALHIYIYAGARAKKKGQSFPKSGAKASGAYKLASGHQAELSKVRS